MALVNFLANRGTRTQIESLIIDVTLNSKYTFKNSITSFPVEDGYFISDHIQQNPNMFSMTGFESNTPLSGRVRGLNFATRDVAVLDKLLEYGGFRFTKTTGLQPVIVGEPKPLDIFTPLRLYTNMYLGELTINRSLAQSGGLWFSANFQQIITVTNQYSIITVVKDVKGAKGMKNKIQNKNKTGKTNGENVDLESRLNAGVNFVKDKLGF